MQILDIIDGHDSRTQALSLNDMIVKDADKLWRYTQSGFRIDIVRFGETFDDGFNRLSSNLYRWFFTPTAIKIAREKLGKRLKEKKYDSGLEGY